MRERERDSSFIAAIWCIGNETNQTKPKEEKKCICVPHNNRCVEYIALCLFRRLKISLLFFYRSFVCLLVRPLRMVLYKSYECTLNSVRIQIRLATMAQQSIDIDDYFIFSFNLLLIRLVLAQYVYSGQLSCCPPISSPLFSKLRCNDSITRLLLHYFAAPTLPPL